MNLKKIMCVSFLVLVISTYQTDSGIILGLMLKLLMLKGALFMSMPIAIGAFMMGQGMGFFAGNMMGGYMMLRAANRYHTKEKNKWISYMGHSPHHIKHYGIGQSPAYHKGFNSAKTVFKAINHINNVKLHALNKAKAAVHGAKAVVHGAKAAVHGSAKGHYGFEINSGKGGGWGAGGHGYSKGNGGYGIPSYTYGPTGYVNTHSTGPIYGSGWDSKGHVNQGYSSQGYTSHQTKGKPYGGYGGSSSISHSNYYTSPGELDYQSHGSLSPGIGGGYDFNSGSYDTNSEYSSNSPISTPWNSPPDSTFYTSAYAGPGQEYTGILTEDGAYPAEKSSERVDGELDDGDTNESIQSFSTAEAPNEVVEQYLEQRLKDEASKFKDVEQKKEAKQLIQLLRKAYLQQLVESLKKEEAELERSSSPQTSSKENRSSRELDSLEYVKYLLNFPGENQSEASKLESTPSQETFTASAKEILFPPTAASLTSGTTSTEKLTTTTRITTTTTEIPSSTTTLTTTTTRKPKTTESPLFKDQTMEIQSIDPEIAAMWIKSETFVDEKSPVLLRFKREASPEEKQVQAFVDDIKRFFTLLSVLDQDQCLQKLVCDVHAKPSVEIEKLGDYEKNIITTFKLMKAMMPESEEDSTTKYRKAALIGETGQSTDICQAAYASCTYSSSQIISLGTQVEKSPGDWTDVSTPATASSEAPTASRRSEYVTAMPRVRRRVLNA